MKFTSEIYPELVIHDLDITFHNSLAEVTDKDTIEALRNLPTELGVRAVGGRPAKTMTSD